MKNDEQNGKETNRNKKSTKTINWKITYSKIFANVFRKYKKITKHKKKINKDNKCFRIRNW